jgi:hypothetical protein
MTSSGVGTSTFALSRRRSLSFTSAGLSSSTFVIQSITTAGVQGTLTTTVERLAALAVTLTTDVVLTVKVDEAGNLLGTVT